MSDLPCLPGMRKERYLFWMIQDAMLLLLVHSFGSKYNYIVYYLIVVMLLPF